MKSLIHSLTVLAFAASGLAIVAPAPALDSSAPQYSLIKKVSLPGNDGWDYLSLDSRARRLYVSRSTHVTVVDVDAGKVVGDIPDTQGVHGIAIDFKTGHGFTSNGGSGTVTIFDTKTLKKIDEVKVGEGPDCILFDPATDRVFTFNGRAQTATAIDAVTGKVVGTVPLPGRPEFAVADGKGHIYDNIEDKSEVVDIDAKTLKVDHAWSLAPGDGPSGLAMDRRNRRLFSVCGNQKMVILDADNGKVVATPTIGNGPDACDFDPSSHRVYAPNGRDGTLTVLDEASPDQYTLLATVPTQAGARTTTLDRRTHHIFTIAATMAPAPPADPAAGAAPPQRRGRRYVPGSVVVLEYGAP